MAYGACPMCGCALEECIREDCGVEIAKPKRGSVVVAPGDWVRVRRGHPLEGAAGQVQKIDRAARPAQVTFKQLNGNQVRVVLGQVELVAYAGEDPDVL